MKRKNLLYAVVLAIAMLISECGNSTQTVEGKWTGYLDLTQQFEDGIKTAYPDLAEYVNFEGLVFVLDVSFEEGQMAIEVQEESIEKFNTNLAKGMEYVAVSYWEAGLATMNTTMEEAVAESGMTEDDYLKSIYQETQTDKMLESMSEVTVATLDKLSKMEGTYTTPVANELRLYYTEDEFESMQYSFKGDKLNITIKGDNFKLSIECEKAD